MAKTTDIQIRLLRTAFKSPDRSILAIGFNKSNPFADYPSFPAATAAALVKRGFLTFFKNATWGAVYKLTTAGEQYIKSYDHPQFKDEKTRATENHLNLPS